LLLQKFAWIIANWLRYDTCASAWRPGELVMLQVLSLAPSDTSLAPSDSSLAPSNSELENRARSLLRWKIRFTSVHVAAVSGHVTLSGEVISVLDRETAEQTIRRLRGVVGVTNCITLGGMEAFAFGIAATSLVPPV